MVPLAFAATGEFRQLLLITFGQYSKHLLRTLHSCARRCKNELFMEPHSKHGVEQVSISQPFMSLSSFVVRNFCDTPGD